MVTLTRNLTSGACVKVGKVPPQRGGIVHGSKYPSNHRPSTRKGGALTAAGSTGTLFALFKFLVENSSAVEPRKGRPVRA